MQCLNFTVALTEITIRTAAETSDKAVELVMKYENAPEAAFVSVYQDDPVPKVSAKFGAPMGRPSRPLDHDGKWKAKTVPLDEGGYDKGGAYWGLRMGREKLFAVQDGMGNIAFVDAIGPRDARERAASE